uniref:Uncharacterized protein n=2 Tax=Salix viminalis TaxID=40686 RepID=A0A6N2LYM7_SALVM
MAHLRWLPHSMKVQKLAVLPYISSKMQTFWVSDGLHSVHTITLSDMDAAVTYDGDETQEKLIRITVIQAVLSAEKIQDLIPLGANGILILGQGACSSCCGIDPEQVHIMVTKRSLEKQYDQVVAVYDSFMASTLEQSPYTISHRGDETEFNLREWAFKAQNSRENTRSRRFSGSNIRSFREDARSFRSNTTISSTASSPGYSLREEIDPSTYSFTTALKALQARSGYSNNRECLSPDGFALNSKWDEAEKYICNPLSGEVPMECLSAKTLSGRSFRSLTNRITMSAPLVFSNHSRQIHTRTTAIATHDDIANHFPIKENTLEGLVSTRDVGTQSTPPELSSSSFSPSPASTPSITERKRCEIQGGDSPNCNSKLKVEEQVQVKGTRGEEEATKREINKEEMQNKNDEQMWRCSIRKQGGCLSWMRKRQREKSKPKKKNFFFSSLEDAKKES